jgi:hypothetical protein
MPVNNAKNELDFTGVYLIRFDYFFQVGHQAPDKLFIIEEPACKDTNDRVGWDGSQHAQDAP